MLLWPLPCVLCSLPGLSIDQRDDSGRQERQEASGTEPVKTTLTTSLPVSVALGVSCCFYAWLALLVCCENLHATFDKDPPLPGPGTSLPVSLGLSFSLHSHIITIINTVLAETE